MGTYVRDRFYSSNNPLAFTFLFFSLRPAVNEHKRRDRIISSTYRTYIIPIIIHIHIYLYILYTAYDNNNIMCARARYGSVRDVIIIFIGLGVPYII